MTSCATSTAVPLLILIGMAGLVLMVAVANIANLLLARAAAKERETAIRLCIGSGRWRLVRQLLTESSVLSLAGGLLGVLLAFWGTGLIMAVFSTWQRPLSVDVSPNPRVLMFATAVALCTGLAFGVVAGPEIDEDRLESQLEAERHGVGGPRTRRIGPSSRNQSDRVVGRGARHVGTARTKRTWVETADAGFRPDECPAVRRGVVRSSIA